MLQRSSISGADRLLKTIAAQHAIYHHTRGKGTLNAKGHGILRCQFTVSDQLDAAFCGGPLTPGAVWDGLARFSNLSGLLQSDGRGDIHSAAFKFFVPHASLEPDVLPDFGKLGFSPRGITAGAPIHTWDIIGNTGSEFFASDAASLQDWYEGGGLKLLFPSLDPSAWRFRQAWNLFKAREKWELSVFDMEYFALPIALGQTAAQLQIITPGNCGESSGQPYRFQLADPNQFRTALVQELSPRLSGMTTTIWAKLRAPGDSLDDLSVKWKDPMIHYVGHISIPPQDFDTAANDDLDRQLYFSNFHAPEVLRPVGIMSELHRLLYRQSFELRSQADGLEIKLS